MRLWQAMGQEIHDFTHTLRERPVVPQVDLTQIRKQLESQYAFQQPVQLEQLFGEMCQLFRVGNVQVTSPHYFGLFNPSVHEAGIVADALVALYNPQVAMWSHGPLANEIERLTLRTLMQHLGLPLDSSIANFTSGGAEANFTSVIAAMYHRFPQIQESGVAELAAKPRIYLTGECHHSFVKVARITGLGQQALCQVETDENHRMDVADLERKIQQDRLAGFVPLMVVGTAGTTSAGLVDPLPEIAALAAKQQLWFHVDAAWGGTAVLSPKLRPYLRGIESADSVTWDAHKWMSVPMGAGMFFCRHPQALTKAFTIHTSYMPEDSEGEPVDQYTFSVQWSRRMIGLKVFMTLAHLGLDGYAQLIEDQANLADYLRERLQQKGWQVRNQTALPVVCFTHPDLHAGRHTTKTLLARIYERGNVWLSDVVLGEREPLLRACVTSFRSTPSDIDYLVQELEAVRQVSMAAA